MFIDRASNLCMDLILFQTFGKASGSSKITCIFEVADEKIESLAYMSKEGKIDNTMSRFADQI